MIFKRKKEIRKRKGLKKKKNKKKEKKKGERMKMWCDDMKRNMILLGTIY